LDADVLPIAVGEIGDQHVVTEGASEAGLIQFGLGEPGMSYQVERDSGGHIAATTSKCQQLSSQ